MKRLNRESTDANVDIDDNTDVESPNDTPSIWVYSPGEGARKWQECLDENVMLLGWDDMENFRDYETRQDIVERLREVYGNTENAYTNDSLAIWQFCREMRPGDIVYVKRGLTLIVGRGVVKGGYTYNGERYEYKNSRAVEWTHSGEWEYPKKLPMKTLTRINDYKEMVERLEGLFDPQEIIEQLSFNMPTVIEGIKKTGLLYEDKHIGGIIMEATIFNPVQQHLLKMFAFDGSEERLLEVKAVLSEYFRKKADMCLDALWESGKLNQAKMDELRHQDLHALLKK